MEGIYFYWILWGTWIYCTFLMRKSNQRTYLAISILLMLISATYYIRFYSVSISAGLIISLLYGYFIIGKKSSFLAMYLFIISSILTMSYVSFRLFQLYDPVWVMFNPTFKLAIIQFFVVNALIKKYEYRIVTSLIGISQGELIYALFLDRILVTQTIGHLEYFDVLAISCFLVIVWALFENFVKWIEDVVMKKRVHYS